MNFIKYTTSDGKVHKSEYANKDAIMDCYLNNKLITKIIETNDFTGIQILNLSGNRIQKIEGFDALTALHTLYLSGNMIQKIEGLQNLMALQILNVNDNMIQKIEGLKNLKILRGLHLSGNRIQKIEGLNDLIDLEWLFLDDNKIKKIEGLDNLTTLECLHLKKNKIPKIEGFGHMTILKEISLEQNQIQKIEGLNALTILQKLDLNNNQIKKIEGLGDLTALEELYLSCNQIQKIENLDDLTALQWLYLSGNQIQTIEGLGTLRTLFELSLNGNQIQKIEGLDGLMALETLYLERNEIEDVPLSVMNLESLTGLHCDIDFNPIIERFLNRNQIKSNRTIYNNKQNVHDNEINKSITGSLYRLLEETVMIDDAKINEEIFNDLILSQTTKEALIEYCKITDVHAVLNVTFMEALKCIWNIIRKHVEADEIKKILDQEMQDSICKCFTGRLSRLVNTLNGYDERVSVKIADSQQISNLISTIRKKTNNVEEQRQLVEKELLERGYNQQVISEWLSYLE